MNPSNVGCTSNCDSTIEKADEPHQSRGTHITRSHQHSSMVSWGPRMVPYLPETLPKTKSWDSHKNHNHTNPTRGSFYRIHLTNTAQNCQTHRKHGLSEKLSQPQEAKGDMTASLVCLNSHNSLFLVSQTLITYRFCNIPPVTSDNWKIINLERQQPYPAVKINNSILFCDPQVFWIMQYYCLV